MLGLLAMRGATNFSVVLAFFSVLARIVQAVSIIIQNEKLAQLCYGLCTLFITLMWFNEFGKENADIIHEAEPKTQVINDLGHLMFPNYHDI